MKTLLIIIIVLVLIMLILLAWAGIAHMAFKEAQQERDKWHEAWKELYDQTESNQVKLLNDLRKSTKGLG